MQEFLNIEALLRGSHLNVHVAHVVLLQALAV